MPAAARLTCARPPRHGHIHPAAPEDRAHGSPVRPDGHQPVAGAGVAMAGEGQGRTKFSFGFGAIPLMVLLPPLVWWMWWCMMNQPHGAMKIPDASFVRDFPWPN